MLFTLYLHCCDDVVKIAQEYTLNNWILTTLVHGFSAKGFVLVT